MAVEVVLALVVGAVTAWFVLQPLARPESVHPPPDEPLDPEETPKGVALTALKEIEFDRETGKLSEADYRQLKARYTTAAVEALRAESRAGAADHVEAMIAARVRSLRSPEAATSWGAPVCPACGPRPEADAVFCSSCGLPLEAPANCPQCETSLRRDSRFCELCGAQVAA